MVKLSLVFNSILLCIFVQALALFKNDDLIEITHDLFSLHI